MLRLGRATGARHVVVLLLVVAALPFDAIIHDLTFRHAVTHEVRLAANGFTHLGTAWAGGGLLGALALAGYRAQDAALTRASLSGLVGIALGSLVDQVAKQTVCRGRPGLFDGWGVDSPGTKGLDAAGRAAARRFFHWPCLGDSRFHGFPSGHATTAFSVAAALACAAPSRRRVWLLVAGGVGASRVLLNAHFVSDVLGGAAIGWWATEAGMALAGRLTPAWVASVGWAAAVEADPRPGVSSR
jgi:membrane-associated phospholipid phosphatase